MTDPAAGGPDSAAHTAPEHGVGCTPSPGRIGRPSAVLLCGVAGSGKTTYALQLQERGFARLSIDEEVWCRHGRFGVDYDPGRFIELAAAAEELLRARLVALLRDGRDVVVDFSFWQRASRDRYKGIVTAAGGAWRLVYFDVDAAELRRRLAVRSGRFDANAAFLIDDALLAAYLEGFEVPDGEGEERAGNQQL